MTNVIHPITRLASLREQLGKHRHRGESIGLVPTMGALHEGHLSLIERARAANDVVVVTVFVNPTQFRPGEDLNRYPRQLDRDTELAAAHGADIVFAPAVGEVYPDGFVATVSVRGMSETLCGDQARRGHEHFDGVATVVTKLFNMVQPDRAYFGQKDAQQCAVIKQLVRDLDIPVEIEIGPTVREADGLAMSSRNAYLTDADRERALGLWHALSAARDAVAAGEVDGRRIRDLAMAQLVHLDVEYFELVDPDTLQPVERIDHSTLAAVAARCDATRLIDNLILEPAQAPAKPEDAADGLGDIDTVPTTPIQPPIQQGAAA